MQDAHSGSRLSVPRGPGHKRRPRPVGFGVAPGDAGWVERVACGPVYSRVHAWLNMFTAIRS